jgi:hypothetical protein
MLRAAGSIPVGATEINILKRENKNTNHPEINLSKVILF